MKSFEKNIEFDINNLVIKDIIVLRASIDNPKSLPALEEESKINTEISIEHALNKEAKMLRLIFSCKLKPSNYNEIEAKFEIAFYFEIGSFDSLIHYEEKSTFVSINETFLTSIANITYSTSRGIIFSRCLGTIFNKFILPPISNEKIIEMLNIDPIN